MVPSKRNYITLRTASWHEPASLSMEPKMLKNICLVNSMDCAYSLKCEQRFHIFVWNGIWKRFHLNTLVPKGLYLNILVWKGLYLNTLVGKGLYQITSVP